MLEGDIIHNTIKSAILSFNIAQLPAHFYAHPMQIPNQKNLV